MPGKFEGEPEWTEYFHELMMNGEGEPIKDEYYGDGTEVTVEPEDKILFPELSLAKKVQLFFDEMGFVYGKVI